MARLSGVSGRSRAARTTQGSLLKDAAWEREEEKGQSFTGEAGSSKWSTSTTRMSAFIEDSVRKRWKERPSRQVAFANATCSSWSGPALVWP